MVLFGRVLKGDEAAQRGLVYAAVEDDQLLDVAMELAKGAADGPGPLVRRVKETMRDIAAVDDHSDAVDLEIKAQLWSVEQPFFKERLAALKAKIANKQ